VADNEEEQRKSRGWVRDILVNYGPAVLLVLLIRAFVFEPFQIPSSSMIPTLFIGDHVFVTKYSYGLWMHFPTMFGLRSVELLDLGDPERGDIIVFRNPQDGVTNYIKRIVGVPGDTISVVDNQVMLNGELAARQPQDRYRFIDDHCLAQEAQHGLEDLGGVVHDVLVDDRPGMLANRPPIQVPPGHVFAMGDNRDNSLDSRQWGFVRYDQIKGKARFVWISWDGCGSAFRVDRMGHDVYDLVPR
jgi:signal peptidase I